MHGRARSLSPVLRVLIKTHLDPYTGRTASTGTSDGYGEGSFAFEKYVVKRPSPGVTDPYTVPYGFLEGKGGESSPPTRLIQSGEEIELEVRVDE